MRKYLITCFLTSSVFYYSCGVTSKVVVSQYKLNSRTFIGKNEDDINYFGVWIYSNSISTGIEEKADSVYLLLMKNPSRMANYKNLIIFENEKKYLILEFENDSILKRLYNFSIYRKYRQKLQSFHIPDSIQFIDIVR